jgi:hypothetical protein
MRIFDPDNEPILYHLHIPKTAGTTVHGTLRARFPVDRVCSVDPLAVMKLSTAKLREYDFFGGHLEFGYHLAQLTGRRVDSVVFIRDPHKILVSMFKHVHEATRDQMRPYVLQNCPDLESFLHDPIVSKYIHNPQTRYLGLSERRFTPEVVEKVRQATTPAQVQEIVRAANDSAAQVSDATINARAGQRLRQCSVVGLVEQLDESLRQVCTLRNWPPQEGIRSRNVSKSKVEIPDERSPAVLRRLDELSQWDRALYDEALGIFNRATAAAKRATFYRRAA